MSFSTRNMKALVYDRRELTIKTCLHFRPVAVILNWVYLMFFLASKDYSRVSSSTTSFSSQLRAFVPPWTKIMSESDQPSVDCCKMLSLQLVNCWTCLIIKRWKYNPHERRCSPGWSVCVCVCKRALKLTGKIHFELRRVQTIKYTHNM